MQIQLHGYTDTGDRAENEDTGTCGQLGESGLFAVVADGLGGHGGGKDASEIAVRTLVQCQTGDAVPSSGDILEWLAQANEEILAKRDGPYHMKTTVVFLAVCGKQAVWAHIGDSRLYHYHNGSLADTTQDHSVCQLAVMLGEITRRQIPGHPDRSRLLRVLGEEDAVPEVHAPVILLPGQHAFLLCTDGLWERLLEDEIMLDLHKSGTPEQWTDSLRRRAQKRRGTDMDNNTAVAVFVEIS